MDITTIFFNYGIPAGISIYLIYWITMKLNGKLDRLTKSIEQLDESIKRLTYIIEYKR